MVQPARTTSVAKEVAWVVPVILVAVGSVAYKCSQRTVRPVVIVNEQQRALRGQLFICYPVFVFISFHNVINISPPTPRRVSCSPI